MSFRCYFLNHRCSSPGSLYLLDGCNGIFQHHSHWPQRNACDEGFSMVFFKFGFCNSGSKSKSYHELVTLHEASEH